MTPLPSLFIAHGAPPLLDDPTWMAELAAWGRALPPARAILMVSAHWESQPAAVGPLVEAPLTYDFYGFPERFYQLRYPAPVAPWLADRVEALLGAAGLPLERAPGRGLDHGAFVPLLPMFPSAAVPVLQLSLPSLAGPTLRALGRLLAPLRHEGVLVVGSGFLTHNLRALDWSMGPPPAWALAFDAWVADVLARGELGALADFEAQAPHARLNHPRTEHFAPVIVAAAAAEGAPVSFPITGWAFGSFSKRSVQFG